MKGYRHHHGGGCQRRWENPKWPMEGIEKSALAICEKWLSTERGCSIRIYDRQKSVCCRFHHDLTPWQKLKDSIRGQDVPWSLDFCLPRREMIVNPCGNKCLSIDKHKKILTRYDKQKQRHHKITLPKQVDQIPKHYGDSPCFWMPHH